MKIQYLEALLCSRSPYCLVYQLRRYPSDSKNRLLVEFFLAEFFRLGLQKYSIFLLSSPFSNQIELRSDITDKNFLDSIELTSHYTRAIGDGPRNLEPWSSDEDDT